MVSASPGAVRSLRCLLVRAGEVVCAIPLEQVRQVVKALRVSALPGARHGLLGVAEHAGEPIAVYDLSVLVDAPPGANPEFPVTVVVIAGPDEGEVVGLNADAAVRFLDLDVDGSLPTSDGVVQGEVVVDDEPVRLLDLRRLGASP